LVFARTRVSATGRRRGRYDEKTTRAIICALSALALAHAADPWQDLQFLLADWNCAKRNLDGVYHHDTESWRTAVSETCAITVSLCRFRIPLHRGNKFAGALVGDAVNTLQEISPKPFQRCKSRAKEAALKRDGRPPASYR
jgi:hypothetical protein